MTEHGRRIAFALTWTIMGCGIEDSSDLEPRGAWVAPPAIEQVPAPLPAAHCQINVEGKGLVDMETDYLPRVIVCENGGANLEALKAQAIAARSVAYYAIETSGGICDSQGCQVYTCNNQPQAIHYQAVEETSGMYLLYNQTLTYGFYVAGDSGVSPPSCVGVSGATEGWVTYNEGKTGTGVQQTALGWIHNPGDNGYGQNRGCMSQWGARCLENHNGYDVLGILRFFYGDDIAITQAVGECVIETEPPGGEETGVSETADDSEGSSGPGGSGPGGSSSGGSGPATTTDNMEPTDGTEDPSDTDRPGLPDWTGDDGQGCACRSNDLNGSNGWWAGLMVVAWRRKPRKGTPPKPEPKAGDAHRRNREPGETKTCQSGTSEAGEVS